MKPSLILAILAAGLVFSACKKEKSDDSTAEDHPSALITVTAPQENDTIQGNFSVTGSIVGTAELHGYQVTLSTTQNDSIIYQNEVHDHLANFTINQAIANNFTAYTSLKIKVVAALDHEGHTETKTVHFTVH